MRIVKIEPTKQLYMDICFEVDRLMKDAAKEFNILYYYFDCIFTQSNTKEIVDFLKERGFGSKIEETRLSVQKIGNEYWMESLADDKLYLIHKSQYEAVKEGLYDVVNY